MRPIRRKLQMFFLTSLLSGYNFIDRITTYSLGDLCWSKHSKMSKSAESAAELSILRAITYRLSSTPTTQLPQQVPAIAASLANCKSLLSSTQASGSKTSSEASVAIHKFRTLLSTLLQDRTIQGRWTAIVLVKATVEDVWISEARYVHSIYRLF